MSFLPTARHGCARTVQSVWRHRDREIRWQAFSRGYLPGERDPALATIWAVYMHGEAGRRLAKEERYAGPAGPRNPRRNSKHHAGTERRFDRLTAWNSDTGALADTDVLEHSPALPIRNLAAGSVRSGRIELAGDRTWSFRQALPSRISLFSRSSSPPSISPATFSYPSPSPSLLSVLLAPLVRLLQRWRLPDGWP